MEILTGGLHTQGAELAGMKADMQQLSEQLSGSATQFSNLEHNQRQCEAAVTKEENIVTTMKTEIEVLKAGTTATPATPPGFATGKANSSGAPLDPWASFKQPNSGTNGNAQEGQQVGGNSPFAQSSAPQRNVFAPSGNCTRGILKHRNSREGRLIAQTCPGWLSSKSKA